MRILAYSLMLASLAKAEIVYRRPLRPSPITILRWANRMVQQYRAQRGVTPEMIEALSWLGRGALAAKQYDKAEAYAEQTQQLVQEQLKKQPLDREPHLPLALGAAIEVQGASDERTRRAGPGAGVSAAGTGAVP